MDGRTLAPCLVLLALACTRPEPPGDPTALPVVERGEQVEPGTSADDVRARLGEPDEVRRWTVSGPRWGPGESLATELPEGTAVESWIWREGDLELWLHLALRDDVLVVVGRDVAGVGAVYESEAR